MEKITILRDGRTASLAKRKHILNSRRSPLSTISLLLLLMLTLPAVTAIAIPAIPSFDLVDRNNEIIIHDSMPPPKAELVKRDTASTSTPQPFDTSLGNNFTSQGCLPFFQSFLNDATFIACSPMSLLLQTSSDFFSVQRDPTALNATLDASCNVNVTDCSQLMSSLNTKLRSASVCGPDLAKQNPIVSQAAAGFSAYDVMYKATCLRDATTNQYCFAEAAGNASAPTSIYTYYLPLGLNLPSQAKPACNTCLRDTMDIFAVAATQSGQLLANDYTGASQTVATQCGDTFVRLNIKVATNSANPGRAPGVASWFLIMALSLSAVLFHSLV
ncbi:hypothetical protein K461DRAFT_275039 [Myriangium duriaei CBS 260.36]|uniref:DUF7729 domain-containing protein n=1 Tax=Myriangium duriaei CBS 260.36 TaxID=1168546 RepID=A0A9P4J5W1_9PEZI|nr:hypothetical protein K461DRAFT_275039 [Myriangium duriaei CBS 260.36]